MPAARRKLDFDVLVVADGLADLREDVGGEKRVVLGV